MDEVASVATVRGTFSAVDRVAERLVSLTEQLTDDQVTAGSRLGAGEREAPGYIDYVRQASLRAARLAQTIADGVQRVYANVEDDDFMVFHFGIEAPLALARTELELIGRIRAMLTPSDLGLRLKAYAALHHYDLTRVEDATKYRDPMLDALKALVPKLERLTASEPDSRRYLSDRLEDENQQLLDLWRVESTAAIRYLSSPENHAVWLFRRLSDAVHGGILVESMWFRPNTRGNVFGYVMLQRVGEMMRVELEDLIRALTSSIKTPVLAPTPRS